MGSYAISVGEESMMRKIQLIIYYLIISKLPHSRYGMIFNTIRCWYVSDILKIMKKSKHNYFENGVYIGNATKVTIGEHCHINENCFLQGVTIGDYVLVAPNVSILNSNHEYRDTTIPIILQGDTDEENPVIEDNVWIGRNVVIMPKIRVEEGTIIGAGAVVTKNVKTFTIVGGVPAKLIKKRVTCVEL